MNYDLFCTFVRMKKGFLIAAPHSGSGKTTLPRVLESGSRAFVASTWPNHTAGHDDLVSIFQRPSEGWGWLIEQGFTILETNFPKDLIQYLQSAHRH